MGKQKSCKSMQEKGKKVRDFNDSNDLDNGREDLVTEEMKSPNKEVGKGKSLREKRGRKRKSSPRKIKSGEKRSKGKTDFQVTFEDEGEIIDMGVEDMSEFPSASEEENENDSREDNETSSSDGENDLEEGEVSFNNNASVARRAGHPERRNSIWIRQRT